MKLLILKFYLMKNLNLLTVVIAFFLVTGMTHAQNIAISDVSHTADASAVLDVYSTSLGMLVPRLSSNPSNPANGLFYYSTSSNSFYYNAGSSASPSWTELSYGNLWSRTGTNTYMTNLTDNAVIGTNANPFGYKFYVHQAGPGLISNSRIDGQLEIWDYTGVGNLMLGDINDNGGANGIMQLYFGGNAGIRLLANGNSYLNGGFVGIGVPMALAPATNVHLFDNFANPLPQFFIDQPGAGNASVGYGIPGRNYAVGLVQDLTGLMNNNYKICDGNMVTPPLNYLDPFTMMEIHNENAQPGIIDFNHQSRARVFQQPNPDFDPFFGYGQIIPNAIWTMVNFDMLSYDEHVEWNLAPAANAGPSYFQVTEDGYYQVNSRIDFILDNYEYEEPIHFPNYPGYVSIAIYVSTDQGQTWNMYAQGNKLQGADNAPMGGWNDLRNNLAPNVSDVVQLNSGDWVAIFAWQDLWGNGLPLRVIEQNGAGGPPTQVYCSIHKSS